MSPSMTERPANGDPDAQTTRREAKVCEAKVCEAKVCEAKVCEAKGPQFVSWSWTTDDDELIVCERWMRPDLDRQGHILGWRLP